MNGNVKQHLRNMIVEQIQAGAYHIGFKANEVKRIIFEDVPGLGVLIIRHSDSRNVFDWQEADVLQLNKLIR